MKKVLYSVLALAGLLVWSCAKEMDAPEKAAADEVLVPMTLTASFDTATKVTYEGMKTFAWEAGDSILVRTVSGEDFEWYAFGAKTSGPSSEFFGEVSDTYRPKDFAVYPGFQTNWNSQYSPSATSHAFRHPITYYLDEVDGTGSLITPHLDPSNCTKVYVSSNDPLKYLPNVGKLQADGSFKFQAAYGVLKIQMTDLDDEACGIRLTSANGYIGNYLMLDQEDLCFKMDAPFVLDGSTYSAPYLNYWFYPEADHSAAIYVPLPVGTLGKGSTIDVKDAKGVTLYTQTFAQDVEVQRGKITTLAPFKAKYDWTAVGTGKFIDTYMWKQAGWTDGQLVDMTIETNGDGDYRVADPYGTAAKAFGYTVPETAYGPSEYLSFTVNPVGATVYKVKTTVNGLVSYDDCYTGVVHATYGVDPYIAHPGGWTSLQKEENFVHNIVTKFASDGTTPAVVQLAPVYFWLTDPAQGRGYSTAGNESYLNDNLVEILFPGETTPTDVTATVAYVDMADDTPAQPVAKVKVTLGASVASADLVIVSEDEDEANLSALLSGASAVHVTASGEYNLNFPADAPSGNYFAVGKVTYAEGINPDLNNVIASEAINYVRTDAWESMGTGKFVDNYNWSYIPGAGMNETVDVEILKNKTVAGYYRVVDPYGTAIAAYSYTPAAEVDAPGPYLDIYVKDGGYVDFDMISTGIYYSSYQEATYIRPPYARFSDYGRSYVMQYQADGTTPANVAIAPIYYWPHSGYWTGNSYIYDDNLIQIVFPGVSELADVSAKVAYVDMVSDDPASAVAKVSVTMGSSLDMVKVVIAADENGAKEAFNNPAKVVEVTASSDAVNVPMPDSPETGDYYIFGITVPKEGISAIAAQSLVSNSFKYVNPNADKGYTLADIVGTYKSYDMYIAYYNNGWQWGSKNANYYFTIAESNDEFQGNIMVTNVWCENETRGFDLETTAEYGPIYGDFDTKTGALVLYGGQPLYWSFSDGTGIAICWMGARSDGGIDLFMDPVGKLKATGRQYLTNAAMSSYYRILGGSSSDNVEFTRQEVTTAPAAAPRKGSRSFNSASSPKVAEQHIMALPFGQEAAIR